jgi:hypothetical protein
MQVKKELLLKIHKSESQVLASIKNANQIIAILKILQSHVDAPDVDTAAFEVSLKAIQAIRTIIQTLRKNGDLKYPRHVVNAVGDEISAADKFQDWMWKNVIGKFEETLLKGLHSRDGKSFKLPLVCLNTLMLLIKMEADAMMLEKSGDKRPLQMEALKEFLVSEENVFFKVIQRILCSEEAIVSKSFLKELFMKFVGEYQDVRFATMHILAHFVDNRQELNLSNAAFRRNAFNVLIRYRSDAQEEFSNYVYFVEVPSSKVESGSKRSMDVDSEEKQAKKTEIENIGVLRKFISNCWMKVISDQWGDSNNESLPMDLRRVFLLHIEEAVFPNLAAPVKLADFLTASYQMEGVIPIMALNGIFILMSAHNFSYPDFYDKLYKLLDPEILYTQHRDKFFALCFLFLKSPNLPGYLLAAFVKKLARIAMCAPAAGAVLCLRIIFNLLRRNAGIRVLVHRTHLPSNSTDSSIDPLSKFEDFSDPEKCQLLLETGSLWEVQTLSEHYSPEVARESLLILETTEWPLVDRDVSEILDQSFNDFFNKRVTKKHGSNCALNFKPPTSFFQANPAFQV